MRKSYRGIIVIGQKAHGREKDETKSRGCRLIACCGSRQGSSFMLAASVRLFISCGNYLRKSSELKIAYHHSKAGLFHVDSHACNVQRTPETSDSKNDH